MSVMTLVHVTIHTRRGCTSLVEPTVAAALWAKLQSTFPEAVASTLMPDHVHLVTPGTDADEERLRLSAVASAVARSGAAAGQIRFEPASTRGTFERGQKSSRQLRYLALNPCRAGLVADPLAWPWSTHRDVMGTVVHPWVTVERAAAATGWSVRSFRERFHRYVSADPSTAVAGTPLPRPAVLASVSRAPIASVLAAALACTRAQPEAIRRAGAPRRVFLSLCRHDGWRDVPTIAALCAASERTIQRHLASAPPPPAEALLCLGDERLRMYLAPPIELFLSQKVTRRAA